MVDGLDDSLINIWEALDGVLRLGFFVINSTYGFNARDEANRVNKSFNEHDLFFGEQGTLEYAESDWRVGVFSQRRNSPWLVRVTDVSESRTWVAWRFAIPPFTVKNRDFNKWYRKDPERVDYFVWIVTAPAARPLLLDFIFGEEAIPEMRAMAVAKPVGGSIEEGRSTYVAKMMPVSSVGVGWVFDSALNRPLRVTH